MFRSKEIRWFNQYREEAISEWFAKLGLGFNTTYARVDHYLVALDNENVTSKLREGNIEIKHRIGDPEKHKLLPNVEGYTEDWVKWSFKLDAKDALSEKIKHVNAYPADWMAVKKTRMGVKLGKDRKGTMKVYGLNDLIDNGCQVEYTRVKVIENIWYTFNLEWFGEQFLALGADFYAEIFEDVVLRVEDSMGYGRFLEMRRNES